MSLSDSSKGSTKLMTLKRGAKYRKNLNKFNGTEQPHVGDSNDLPLLFIEQKKAFVIF